MKSVWFHAISCEILGFMYRLCQLCIYSNKFIYITSELYIHFDRTVFAILSTCFHFLPRVSQRSETIKCSFIANASRSTKKLWHALSSSYTASLYRSSVLGNTTLNKSTHGITTIVKNCTWSSGIVCCFSLSMIDKGCNPIFFSMSPWW